MTTVNLTLTLPDAVALRARSAGLLDADAVAAMLEAEMRRRELSELAQLVERAPKPADDGMTDEQIQQFVQEEIDAVRAERRERQQRLARGA